MGRAVVVRLLALLIAGLLVGCSHRAVPEAAQAVAQAPEEAGEKAGQAASHAQMTVAEVAVPVVVAAQAAAGAIEEAIPTPTPPPPAELVDPAAVALIVRWEVTSPSFYARRLQGVICPGGASGPTWGIGYDGGHQTADRITEDWAMRADRDRLSTTSGKVGPAACANARAELRDVAVPFDQASEVFAGAVLPAYTRAARRALPGLETVPPRAAGALVSLGFNRGWSMLGSRAAEKRAIRDTCVPVADVACIAAQLRAMKRLWPTVPGLQARREAEAVLAESGA